MRAKTIGLIANAGKAGAAELARAVMREFAKGKVKVLLENEAATLLGKNGAGAIAEVAKKSQLLVVLGGDGTLLNAVAGAGKHLKPVFGINIGSLGFLTCANSSAYKEAVDAIAAGRVIYSKRALLQVELRSATGIHLSAQALNDAVISRGDLSRLIRLRTKVNGEPLTEYNADGLVVATPTGSTAYSLSAGGPILAPESGAVVITPISPHVLTNRSVILSDRSEIEISLGRTENPAFLSLDGQPSQRIPDDGIVTITRAPALLKIGFLPGVSFFSVLRQKLKWSGSNV